MNDSKGTSIIDPPVGPWNSSREIKAWLDELATMSDDPEVIRAREDAEKWLVDANEWEDKNP